MRGSGEERVGNEIGGLAPLVAESMTPVEVIGGAQMPRGHF